jgi:hypothetical protein
LCPINTLAPFFAKEFKRAEDLASLPETLSPLSRRTAHPNAPKTDQMIRTFSHRKPHLSFERTIKKSPLKIKKGFIFYKFSNT